MNIFQPKDKEKILMDIAKGRPLNRAFVIGMYEKHPEKFDKFLELFLKIPLFDFKSGFQILQKTDWEIREDEQYLKNVLMLFNHLGFDVKKCPIHYHRQFLIPEHRYHSLKLSIGINEHYLLNYYLKFFSQYGIARKNKKTKKKKRPKV